MKNKQESPPKLPETYAEWAVLGAKLFWNKPLKMAEISRKYVAAKAGGNWEPLGVTLGNEVVEVMKTLEPEMRAIIKVLLSSNEATNLDELYESVGPFFDKLLNKPMAGYGVSLTGIGMQTILTEQYIKTNLLPLFLIVRDIPKFCKSIKEKDFLTTINGIKAQLLSRLGNDLHSEIRKHLVVGSDGLYAIEPQDPALVSQIKKILNALVYAEKVITFINSMDLNPENGFKLEALFAKKGKKQMEFITKMTWRLAMQDSTVGKMLRYDMADVDGEEEKFIAEIVKIIGYARKAQSSLLEVDIPMYKIFGEELTSLRGVIDYLQMKTSEGTRVLQDKVAEKAGHYIGKPMGIFIEQLKPEGGKTDYSYLTHHLGLLPGYLDQLTQLIYSYANQPTKKLAITEAETEAFKASGIRLFFELSNYDDLMFWQKGKSLLMPIRKDAIALSQGAYQQVLRVNEATGEMVAHQLSRVKNELFTKIIAESDKMELYLGLSPGVLTKPLMLQLNEVYQTLVLYANYVIDLKDKYPDLLQLENTSFLTVRLRNTLQQKNECQLKVDAAQKAKHDLVAFNRSFKRNEEKEQRAALNKLYKSFEQYVIEYDPKLSVQIHEFLSKDPLQTKTFTDKKFQLMIKAVQKLCDKEIATFGSYLKMAESRLSELPKQIKGKLYPLDRKKAHSFLIVNEINWLNPENNKNIPLNTQHQFIANLTSTTKENRAELYNYYCIRSTSLQHIRQEIDVFLQQLATPDWFEKQKNINAIIEKYRVLQPYLVDALRDSANDETDDSFVELLNELSKNAKKPEACETILAAMTVGMNELKQQIGSEIQRSEQRKIVFERVHHQVREEQTTLIDKAPLTLDSELVQRQNKWIRHQRFSRASGNMKNVLINLMTHFDPSLKLTVKSNSDDMAPFPEMETYLQALTEPSQVSWVKRMLNVVHYINSNFKYLESLDKKIAKNDVSKYFLAGPLVEGIYQLKPYLELTKAYQTLMELMQEPTGQILADTLKGGFSELMGAWQTIQPLYFINSTEVQVENPAPVKGSGLWYPLVSFLVVPEHLTGLASGRSYKPVDAKEAHKKAKDISQFIEKVTEEFQASQYFNLLMKSPYIVFKLLPELKAKLSKFRLDIHGATIPHLQDIQASLQTILKETDDLELRFGLRAGLISNPAKLILDKIFNKFIDPLGISLLESAKLVSDTTSYKQRLVANRQKQIQTRDFLKNEQQSSVLFEQFLKDLERIKAKIDAKQELSSAEKEQFKEQYWTIYPHLQSQQEHYTLSLDQRDKSVALDKFCDECFKEKLRASETAGQVYHYNSLNDVMHLVKHVHAAKKGNINTLEMQSGYLNVQAQAIESAEQQFVKKEGKEALDACIQHAIDIEIELICKKTSQSVHLASQFKTKLLEVMLAKKNDLLKKVSTIPVNEVEKTISSELQKQFQLFNETENVQINHLDCILVEIARYQSYCQKEKLNPVYEDTNPLASTLSPKIKLLEELEVIAKNKNESFANRISQIKKMAGEDSFRAVLMKHDGNFKFELKALKRLFYNLLNSIFNFSYHPEDIYSSLDKVIKNEKSDLDKYPAQVARDKAIKNEKSSSAESNLVKQGLFAKDGPDKAAGRAADAASDLSDKKPNLP